MSRPEVDLSPNRSAMDRFGYELRTWRKARGLSQDSLGAKVHVSGDTVRLIEVAKRRASRDFVERCDRVLDTLGALVRLWESSESERITGGRDFATHTDKHFVGIAGPSETSSTPRFGETIVVQMTSLTGEPVAVAIDRRTFLAGIATMPAVTCLGPSTLGTAGIPIPVSDGDLADVIQNITRLRTLLVEQDNILGPVAVVTTAIQQLSILQKLSQAATGQSRMTLTRLQATYAEFTGWLADDLGDRRIGQHWIDRALEWAHEGDDDQAIGYVLLRKAQRAADTNDAFAAVNLARAAQRQPSATPRMRAAALQFEALGHALGHDECAFRQAIDTSRDLIAPEPPPVDGEYAPWCNIGYIAIHEASGWMRLGNPNRAADVYEQALTGWPGEFRRDEGVYWGRLARAYADAGQPEQAASAGNAALRIAAHTGSARITKELISLPAALEPWRRVEKVRDFVAGLDQALVKADTVGTLLREEGQHA